MTRILLIGNDALKREGQRELHLPGNRVEVMDGSVECVLEMLEEILTRSQSA